MLDALAWQVTDEIWYNHSLTHSLSHSLTHSLTHSRTHSRTHLFIHSGGDPCLKKPCEAHQNCERLSSDLSNYVCLDPIPSPCMSNPCSTNEHCVRQGLFNSKYSCICISPYNMGDQQCTRKTFRFVFINCTYTIIYTFIGRVKRAPHWDVQSRFRVIYICIYVHASVVVQKA